MKRKAAILTKQQTCRQWVDISLFCTLLKLHCILRTLNYKKLQGSFSKLIKMNNSLCCCCCWFASCYFIYTLEKLYLLMLFKRLNKINLVGCLSKKYKPFDLRLRNWSYHTIILPTSTIKGIRLKLVYANVKGSFGMGNVKNTILSF